MLLQAEILLVSYMIYLQCFMQDTSAVRKALNTGHHPLEKLHTTICLRAALSLLAGMTHDLSAETYGRHVLLPLDSLY